VRFYKKGAPRRNDSMRNLQKNSALSIPSTAYRGL